MGWIGWSRVIIDGDVHCVGWMDLIWGWMDGFLTV